MKHKSTFSDLKEKLLHSRNSLRSPQIMHPKREWEIGLLFGFLLLGGIAVWSSYMYLTYRSAESTDTTVAATEITFNRSLIQEALDGFVTRKNEHDVLLAPAAALPVATSTANDTQTDTFVPEEAAVSDTNENATPSAPANSPSGVLLGS